MNGDDGLREAIELLPAWLPQQYWFGRAGSTDVSVELVSATLLADAEPRLWHVLVEATHDDGTDVFQVPLSIRRGWLDRLDRVHLGMTSEGHVYDALHDKDATEVLLRYFDEAPAPAGLSFHLESGGKVPHGERSLVLPGDHSNTNVAYGDVARLKVFRKIDTEINPDVEIHKALTDAGLEIIAPLYGRIDGSWRSSAGESRTANLAMMQDFLKTASDGWAQATASVRDLYAEGDLHADEVGGDFAAEAFRLGMATARVHETMAETMQTGFLDQAGLAELADSIDASLDTAIGVVPELERYVGGLRTYFDALRQRKRPVATQRVHGNYHLGQVLRTVTGWKLIDFEGAVTASPEQRRALDSPMRDVAGMLRSFDYAAQHLLLTDHPAEDTAHDQIVYRAREWSLRNGQAFCSGYAAASQNEPNDELDVIRAYEAAKAVKQAVFEARYRPSWLPIPLAAIERFTE